MQETTYKLDVQRREYGELTAQLYAMEPDGQHRLVDTFEGGPFEDRYDVASWLRRQFLLDAQSALR